MNKHYLAGLLCDCFSSLRSCPLPAFGRRAWYISFTDHMKNARNWTFFWLDRKQYGWFALFWLAKMPLSVSCCWFQSAFLLAYNTHASSLSIFCWLSFLEFEECLNRGGLKKLILALCKIPTSSNQNIFSEQQRECPETEKHKNMLWFKRFISTTDRRNMPIFYLPVYNTR